MTVINNEYTKGEIRKWLEEGIKRAQNPDPKIAARRKREKRRKECYKNFGL